jgi:carboxyl-terminal processing protease
VHSEILKELKNDNLNYLDLGIKRGPNSTFLTISVFPEDINPISVYDLGVQSGVLHIYVLRFYPGTADEVDQLVSRAIAEHDIHGVIIDLRNNGGGLTSEAQALSGLFLDRGTLLYEMSGRAIGVERIFTQASPKFSRLDVSIIVNGRSASSSEIVAAAFQAHGRGKIIGWPTYGKGTVQRMFPVDGGAIKITVAEYKDGGLRKIDSVGVLPDVLIANVDPRVRPSRFEQDPARFAARREVGLALSTSETDQ